MAKKEENTGPVATVDDSGRPVTLDRFTTFTSFSNLQDGSVEWLKGGSRYELDGEHCNQAGGWLVTASGRRVKLPG